MIPCESSEIHRWNAFDDLDDGIGDRINDDLIVFHDGNRRNADGDGDGDGDGNSSSSSNASYDYDDPNLFLSDSFQSYASTVDDSEESRDNNTSYNTSYNTSFNNNSRNRDRSSDIDEDGLILALDDRTNQILPNRRNRNDAVAKSSISNSFSNSNSNSNIVTVRVKKSVKYGAIQQNKNKTDIQRVNLGVGVTANRSKEIIRPQITTANSDGTMNSLSPTDNYNYNDNHNHSGAFGWTEANSDRDQKKNHYRRPLISITGSDGTINSTSPTTNDENNLTKNRTDNIVTVRVKKSVKYGSNAIQNRTPDAITDAVGSNSATAGSDSVVVLSAADRCVSLTTTHVNKQQKEEDSKPRIATIYSDGSIRYDKEMDGCETSSSGVVEKATIYSDGTIRYCNEIDKRKSSSSSSSAVEKPIPRIATINIDGSITYKLGDANDGNQSNSNSNNGGTSYPTSQPTATATIESEAPPRIATATINSDGFITYSSSAASSTAIDDDDDDKTVRKRNVTLDNVVIDIEDDNVGEDDDLDDDICDNLDHSRYTRSLHSMPVLEEVTEEESPLHAESTAKLNASEVPSSSSSSTPTGASASSKDGEPTWLELRQSPSATTTMTPPRTNDKRREDEDKDAKNKKKNSTPRWLKLGRKSKNGSKYYHSIDGTPNGIVENVAVRDAQPTRDDVVLRVETCSTGSHSEFDDSSSHLAIDLEAARSKDMRRALCGKGDLPEKEDNNNNFRTSVKPHRASEKKPCCFRRREWMIAIFFVLIGVTVGVASFFLFHHFFIGRGHDRKEEKIEDLMTEGSPWVIVDDDDGAGSAPIGSTASNDSGFVEDDAPSQNIVENDTVETSLTSPNQEEAPSSATSDSRGTGVESKTASPTALPSTVMALSAPPSDSRSDVVRVETKSPSTSSPTPKPTSSTIGRPVQFLAPDWIIPQSIGTPYPSMNVNVGDSLMFYWSQGAHDVWIYPSGTCDPTGAIQVGSMEDNPTTYTFREGEEGATITFACNIGSHCLAGMIMNVTVGVKAENTPGDVSSTVPANSSTSSEPTVSPVLIEAPTTPPITLPTASTNEPINPSGMENSFTTTAPPVDGMITVVQDTAAINEVIRKARREIELLIFDDDDLIGKFLRLVFHDCVGGCDGCVDLTNPENKGLDKPIEALQPVADRFEPEGLSRTDVWMTAALLASELALPFLSSDLSFPLHWIGRQTCEARFADPVTGFCGVDFEGNPSPCSPDRGPHVPQPHGTMGTASIQDFFDTEFGFDAQQVTALMGAHSVGKMARENVGFVGTWDMSVSSLDSGYWLELAGKPPDFFLETVGNSDLPNIPDRHQWRGIIKGMDTKTVAMLNVDVALVHNVGDMDTEGNVGCAGPSIPLRDCPFDTPFLPFAKEYNHNERKFLMDFRDVLNILIDHGHKKPSPNTLCPEGRICTFGHHPGVADGIGLEEVSPRPTHSPTRFPTLSPSRPPPKSFPDTPPGQPKVSLDRTCYNTVGDVLVVSYDFVSGTDITFEVFRSEDVSIFEGRTPILNPRVADAPLKSSLACGEASCHTWMSKGGLQIPTSNLVGKGNDYVVLLFARSTSDPSADLELLDGNSFRLGGCNE